MRAVAGWQLPLPDGPRSRWSCFMEGLFKHLKGHVSWSRLVTLGCSWDRLLQLICPHLYLDIVIFNLTLFFDFKWRWQELQGQLTEKQGSNYVSIHMYLQSISIAPTFGKRSRHMWEWVSLINAYLNLRHWLVVYHLGMMILSIVTRGFPDTMPSLDSAILHTEKK